MQILCQSSFLYFVEFRRKIFGFLFVALFGRRFMKKTFFLFFVLLFVSFFCVNCGEAERRPVKVSDDADSGAADADHEDQTDTGNDTEENNDAEEPEAPDDVESEPDENPDIPDDEPGEPADEENTVFTFGPYMVNMIEVKSNKDDAPRNFRIYEPTGAEGPVPVIHFLHGFQLKYDYYDNILMQLSSHGFIVISSQSDHGVAGIGGDTSSEEAAEVITLINWLKENLAAKILLVPDFENFGVAGHSRGGKVTNRVLNTDPTIAKSFFGVDPVDSAPPIGKDPQSLNDPVQFTGESMFLGTEKGPQGFSVGDTINSACAPEGDNSAKFYASYPSPSHHIIAAGVGHNDMIDANECGQTCSVCASSGDAGMNLMFVAYTGGLMTAFFNSTLKGETEYEALLNDSSTHPFMTIAVEHK